MTAIADVLGWAPERLDTAQRKAAPVGQLPEGLTVETAYAIQHALIARRTGRGERLAGVKLGFTSRAKMAQMGVGEVIVGQLTDAMCLADGSAISLARFIHPRAEPEIAFRMARDLGPGNHGDIEIESCVDAVAPALEIIDSRYRDFRFTLPDVVADNASAAGFVIGPWSAIDAEIGSREVHLVVGGTVVQTGSTAAILGHPLRALQELAALAPRYGLQLRAGQVVLAGAATPAVPLTVAAVEAHVAGLGSVSVRGAP
jgi:2-oxo-3-hexenedioate decarboxylase